MATSTTSVSIKDYQCPECGATYASRSSDCCDECVDTFYVADEFPNDVQRLPETLVILPRTYLIKIRVTDKDIDYSKLRWLLEEAGHILNIKEIDNE
jgi:hypothetical protein